MNSAELVNLILEKMRRVEFLEIVNNPLLVKFAWGGNEYTVVEHESERLQVHRWVDGWSAMDNYQRHVEDRLNGLVRNDAGELVPCEN